MRKFFGVSAKKLAVFLCIIAVSVSGLVFATMNTLNMYSRNTSTSSTSDENAASKVTIYGNGLTFINYETNVEIHSDKTIQFYLPANALTDTLQVWGINVSKIATSQENHPIIERNDIITVYTEDATYTGKFLGWGDMLLLEANNGTVMIPGDRITRIVLTEVVQTEGPKTLVTVTTDSEPGNYPMKVSYLMRGPTWKPTYFIDVETSWLECWATIENVENWNNITLVLVSGGPHVVYYGPFVSYDSGSQLFFGSPVRTSIDFSSSTADEYHEYVYGAVLSFEKGTVARLPLLNGTVTLRQEYLWNGGEVQNRYHVNNTLAEPLAAGVANFYRGETWIGQDNISYTPVKAESVALVNYAYDIKVTSTVTKALDESHHQLRGISLTVQNHKTAAIEILVQQDIGGYTLITSTPTATRVGSILEWNLNVDAGSSANIYYEWEHYW